MDVGEPSCPQCTALRSSSHPIRKHLRRVRHRHKRQKTREQLTVQVRNLRTKRNKHLRTLTEVRHNPQKYLTLIGKVKEHVDRRDLKSVVVMLDSFHEYTCRTENSPFTTALTIAQGILSRLAGKQTGDRAPGRGVQANDATIRLTGMLRSMVGKQAYSLLSRNLALPSESTARSFYEYTEFEGVPFAFGIRESNFVLAKEVYRRLLPHSYTPRPVLLAEDETRVNPRVAVDPVMDEVCGTCGPLCAQRCGDVATCRRKGCGDRHMCDLGEGFYAIGSDPDSYLKLTEHCDKQRVATMLRAVIINPMQPEAPKLPIALLATCNTFTCDGYIEPQWARLKELYDKHLRALLGPLVAHSTDGDSRRRRAQLHASRLAAGSFGLEDTKGFTYFGYHTGGEHSHVVIDIDQDYVHCLKKLVNSCANSSRQLLLGPLQPASLSDLVAVRSQFHPNVHGLLLNDLNREGYQAMDVPSAVRLVSPAMMRCLYELVNGNVGVPAHPQLMGMYRFLRLVRRYLRIFMSPQVSQAQKVVDAAYVTTYLRRWRLWCKNTPEQTTNENFVTEEAMLDAVLSCHYAVLLMKLYREEYPGVELDLSRTGTDCCESYFSSLGSFVDNKRTYSCGEALTTTRAQYRILMLAGLGGVHRPKTKRDLPKWVDDDTEVEQSHQVNFDAGFSPLWVLGVEEATRDAITDRLRPQGPNYPLWWVQPELYDPRNKQLVASEEDLLFGEEENKHDSDDSGGGRPDDAGDDDDDDSGVMDNADSVLKAVAGSLVEAEHMHSAKLSHKLWIPDLQKEVSKLTVMKWINDGRATLSSDRTVRIQSSMKEQSVHRSLDLAEDDWVVGLGDDVAVKFTTGRRGVIKGFIGRIVRMRRQHKSKRWVNYTRPVTIHGDRKDLQGLWFRLHWYAPLTGSNNELRYRFTSHDTKLVETDNLICPVTMTWHSDGDYYVLSPEHHEVIRASEGGAVSWDGSDG